MRNAKEEFLKHVRNLQVKCVKIDNLLLKVNHTKEDYNNFLKSLDFEYTIGYNNRLYSSTIWFKDGTWSTRTEADGCEWWEHHNLPEIPKELL